MECGIKYCHHRSARHQFLACTDSDQVSRVMKRCQIVALFNRLQHLICDHYRACKLFSAMYHAVSYRADFIKALYYASISVCQSVDHELDCLCMCRHCLVRFYFLTASRLIGQTSIDSDTLAKPFGKNIFGFRVDKLEF